MNEKRKIIIIGHRGANNLAPENTIKSFKKAIELEADYIEFDVQLTTDNEIVIFHDANVYKLTGYDGRIKDMKLAELKKLNCGEGEKIPTLMELIRIAKGKINLQCEVKAQGFTEKLVNIFREENLIENSITSSFILSELLNIQKLENRMKLGLLISDKMDSLKQVKKLTQKAIKHNFFSVHPYYEFIDLEYIKYVHENNLKVIAWTVNNRSDLENLINLGVDGIITDDIPLAKDVLNR